MSATTWCELCVGSPQYPADQNLLLVLDLPGGEFPLELSVCIKCLYRRAQRTLGARRILQLARPVSGTLSLRPLQRLAKKRRR